MALSRKVVITLNFKAALCILGLNLLSPLIAQALELDASVYSETEYTSNAELATTNVEDDVIERLGLNIALREDGDSFRANSNFNLSQEIYLNNTYPAETELTTGFGLFNFDIIDDFLSWRTSFTRAQVLSDSSVGDTPDNREDRDTLRSGPNVSYRINQASVVFFSANYIQVESSDEQAADTKRIGVNGSYTYQYNSVTDLSLSSDYDRVIEVQENGQTRSNSDEHSQNVSANVGMNRQFSHGSFSAQVGRNEVRSETRETVAGNFFNIHVQREHLYYHNITAQYSESISDSSIGFETLESLIAANPNFSLDNPRFETTSQLDTIKRKNLEISIYRDLGLYQYTFSTFWTDQNYQIQQNDERSLGFILDVRQQIQQGLTAGFTYEQVKQKFLDNHAVGDNFTQTYTLDAAYRWTQDFSTNAFVAYEQRRNDINLSREYENVSVGVTLNWDLY